MPEAGEPINLAHADEDQLEQPGVWTRTKEVLSIPTLRWIIIGQAMLFAGVSGLFSFAATFFYRVHDLPEGAAAGIAGGLGLIGLLVGGVFASRIGDRHHGDAPGLADLRLGVRPDRRGVLRCCSFALIPILPLQIVLYLIINFANIIALANLGAAQADVIPARMRGTGFATAQFLVTIGSSFGAIIVGTVSAYVIRGETDVKQSQVKDAEKTLEDAKEARRTPESVVDRRPAGRVRPARHRLRPAQALGIRWGIASLFVVLLRRCAHDLPRSRHLRRGRGEGHGRGGGGLRRSSPAGPRQPDPSHPGNAAGPAGGASTRRPCGPRDFSPGFRHLGGFGHPALVLRTRVRKGVRNRAADAIFGRTVAQGECITTYGHLEGT